MSHVMRNASFAISPRGRVRARITVVVTAVALVVLVFGSTAARASAEVVRTSWWTSRSAAIATPPGGFEIAKTLDGVSVAAVRVQTTGAVLPTTLALQEVPGAASAGAAVQLCVVAGDFADASGGAIAGAPATECATPVPVTRGVDFRWTADITSFLTAGTATSFAIVPGPGATASAPFDPGFSVVFSGAAVVVRQPTTTTTAGGGGGTDSTTTTQSTTTTTQASGSPFPTFGGGPPPTAIVPRPVPPPTFAPPPDPAVTPTTIAPPVGESTSEILDSPTAAAGPISGSSGDGAPWIRLLVLIPLSAAAGAGSVYGKRVLATVSPAG